MNFINDKHFGAIQKDTFDNNNKSGEELVENEVLNSNNVELIAKYAKENRSREAIARVRELLELARKTGEEVVQNFFNSFKECERKGMNYLKWDGTSDRGTSIQNGLYIVKIKTPTKVIHTERVILQK